MKECEQWIVGVIIFTQLLSCFILFKNWDSLKNKSIYFGDIGGLFWYLNKLLSAINCHLILKIHFCLHASKAVT